MSDFTTAFRDDFNGSSIDRSTWTSIYSGTYGNGMFDWTSDQIEVGGGHLTIATENEWGGWVSGGLATIPHGQTYGRYEFRARFDEGQGTAGAILLWPSNNVWTDEVDIVETHDPSRDSFAFTNHGGSNETRYINIDVSDWHTYQLDWTPGSLVLRVDGNEVARITDHVPSQEMSFGMQGMVMGHGDTWFGGAPDGSTPDRVEIEIDWVQVSRWTPGEGNSSNSWENSSSEEWEDDSSDEEWGGDAAVQSAAAGAGGQDWIAAAELYLEHDGDWEGSWRNQVESGQMTVQDVANLLEAGHGDWSLVG